MKFFSTSSSSKNTRKTKPLIWLFTLVLILACAPAAITPPPPSDPNAIQLYLQQTAGAAATQTQRAIPTATATSTITPTPRSTFTLEPTATSFTFVLPSPSYGQHVQYFRAKHDNQLAFYNYQSRTAAPDWRLFPQTPEIVILWPAPKEGTGTHRTPITGGWERFMDDLNNNNEGELRYLKSATVALFNGAGFPQMESLTMGGNIITLEAIQGTWGRVRTMNYDQPGVASQHNYEKTPEFVHKFVIVVWSRRTKSTYWVNPPKGDGDIYYPFVTRNDVWIQMDRLEPFPILPMQVTGLVDQVVRKEPRLDSDPTNFDLTKGESATIVQYHPSGSNVWGRLQNGNWIALFQYTNDGPTYFTTWSMATLPPPP